MKASYAIQRPVDNEYLVRDRDRRRVRELLRIVLWVLPVALVLLAYIGVHLAVLDQAYAIQGLEERLEVLDREERQLRLEAAYLESPPRVERRARDELGLRPPDPQQVVFWNELTGGPPGGSP